MKMTITQSMFHDQFTRSGRGDSFSYHGLNALYDYREEMYNGEYDLDVVGLCGLYSEYETAIEAMEDAYCEDYDDEDEAMSELMRRTSVIEFHGGLIICN